jgi:CRP-like cAMP-binding protein
MDILSERLQVLPVFSKLSPLDRFELLRLGRRQTYGRGDFVCQQGDVWPNVVYINWGRVQLIMLSQDGKRQLIFEVGEGELFWGHSLFDDLPMPAALEVKDKCELYLWTKEVLAPRLSRNPAALWDLIRVQSQTMRRAREIIYGFAFHPAAGRLARLLLSRYAPADGQTAARDLTLDDMAASVGTTRELVCKLLYRFAEEGMLSLNRTEFVFMDRGKLEELANQA